MRAFRVIAADFFYLLPFFRYKGPKKAKNAIFSGMLTDCQTYLFSQTRFCVQYITVSNKLLFQASTGSIFILVYSSVVNMLRSYHAALAKPLSFNMQSTMHLLFAPLFIDNGIMT